MSSFDELLEARKNKQKDIENLLAKLSEELKLVKALDETVEANCPHRVLIPVHVWRRDDDCNFCNFFGAHKSCTHPVKVCEECSAIP